MSAHKMVNGRTPKIERALSNNSDLNKDPVRVYCRLRSLTSDKDVSCIRLLSATILSITTPTESKGVHKEISYKYQHIFTSCASQKEVFNHVAHPLLEDLLNGKNGLLFTYGVTGSGKTYTLTGEQTNPGIMPKCIDTLFNTIGDYQTPKYVIKPDRMNGFEVQSESEAMKDRLSEIKSSNRTPKSSRRAGNGDRVTYLNDGVTVSNFKKSNLYSIFITYIEIYNNTVFDLLEDSSSKTLQSKILREDSQKNMYVNGVVEMEVKSAEEAFELFNMGQKRKRMGHTNLNADSSRSHSIFTIRVVQLEQVAMNGNGEPMIPDQNVLKMSQLCLVDLAGSERTNRTQNTGIRLKEASSINNSLMSLRTCLEILRENQLYGTNKLVPYRDSRLTLLFKNYFEGQGNVSMIVCVNPSTDDYDENLQVMKFAEISQEVKIIKPEARYTPYKKPVKKVVANGTGTPSVTKVKPTMSFTLGPKIPCVELNTSDLDEREAGLERLLRVFEMRRERGKSIGQEISKKEKRIRERLQQIHHDQVLHISEMKDLKYQLKMQRQQGQNLENKILALESNNNSIAEKNDELQRVIHSLRKTVNEKDLKLNQNALDREKVKQQLVLANEKKTHEIDFKLRRQREHLEAAMKAKDSKIRKAKEILENEQPPPEMDEVENLEPNVIFQDAPLMPMESEPLRNTGVTPSRRRRSRSTGDVWLEHNVIKPVALNTVMQPSMKKRKSVTKLTKAADITNTKQSKYCLLAQEADTDGELETKLYKGDIVPTCGGGAQVIFNDVERLRQESPTATKK